MQFEDEDLVQDAFVKVLEAARTQAVPTPERLLSKTVRRLGIDAFRKRTRRGTFATSDIDDYGVDLLNDPERTLIGHQRLRNVLETIEAMPARRKAVFVMHRVKDMSYPAIAAELGISIKAVEGHINLALKQLVESDNADRGSSSK